jgi:hypothetical protein
MNKRSRRIVDCGKFAVILATGACLRKRPHCGLIDVAMQRYGIAFDSVVA